MTTIRLRGLHFAGAVALFLSALVLTTSGVKAQTGVGINPSGNPAHSSAGLDVDFNNRGVLIPRVALASTFDVSTIPSPATSLLVYNTALSGDVTPGFYFYTGSAWERIQTGAGGGGGGGGGDWTTSGSSTYLTNTSGRVGIGTSSPSSSYDLTIGGGIGGGILVNGTSTTSDFNGYVAIGNVSPSSSWALQVGSSGLRVTGASIFTDRCGFGMTSTPSSTYDMAVNSQAYIGNGLRVGTTSSPGSNGILAAGEIRSNTSFYLGSSTTGTGTVVVRTSGGLLRPSGSTIRVKDNIKDLAIDREKVL
jgi:hypothetical protein